MVTKATKKKILGSKRRIRIEFGVTANLGNFESGRVDFSFETDVPDGEDLDKFHKAACDVVKKRACSQADYFGPVAELILKGDK